MSHETKKTKTFDATQPSIPGVPIHAAEAPVHGEQAKFLFPYLLAGGGVAILVLIVAIMWWAHGVTRATNTAPTAGTTATPVAQSALPRTERTVPVAPGVIATTSEMKGTWSTKNFVYRNPGGDTFPALLVHLPGDAFWAISLREPYGTCELELASVEKLQSAYNFEARHPMIGSPCTKTIYDLTQYGNGPNGVARGAVIAGVGIRPPLAVEVQVNGDKIIASRSE